MKEHLKKPVSKELLEGLELANSLKKYAEKDIASQGRHIKHYGAGIYTVQNGKIYPYIYVVSSSNKLTWRDSIEPHE